jgi:hypothetical protein
MQDAPIAGTASHCLAAKWHFLKRENCVDQFQAKPLCRHGILPHAEGNHVFEVKVSPFV